MGKRIPRCKLLAELNAVADTVDGTPTQEDMREHGEYSIDPYQRQFGSWNTAVETAGYEPNHQQQIVSDQQLIADLRAFAEELGETPTARQMVEFGPHSRYSYSSRFGSWNQAIEAAGLEVNQRRSAPDRVLLDELVDFAIEVEGVPTSIEMKKRGPRNPGIYVERFGSWDAALEKVGLELSQAGDAEAAVSGNTPEETASRHSTTESRTVPSSET